MANKRLGPEDARTKSGAEGETDVTGHGRRLDKVKATHPIDEPGAGPEHGRRLDPEGEDDVEGHNFGHNAMLSRNASQSREREIQRNLKQHDLKGEARRPFLKGR
jgi:hypothetical protein